ncbi:MAG: polyprenyl synthetase family protein [Alphaproteobacteria bacterium]|nr:polyprenyl synthetase family protein [Alphaproteobacteria bacterium]
MFRDVLKGHAARVETCLGDLFDDMGKDALTKSMRYGVLSGGKRLRAFLVLEGAGLYGIRPQQADRVAAAVECIHAYSLIHDDLPAMDDDDLRRGKPTVHKKWDEATAILAGDALQTMGFQILASTKTSADANIRLRLIASLTDAVGAKGMVLGQMQDIAAETAKRPLNLNQITELQANKTGALFTWAAEAGPVLGNTNTSTMRDYAQAVGMAFQIADDILDIEGDAAKAGKRLQKDKDAGKATFVSLLGLDGAKAKAAELVEQACDGLEIFGGTGDNLRQLARFIIDRDM